jgi:NAD(P)-dependent dehydrogenase (short-subunit alcohol dehydrogenase family)
MALLKGKVAIVTGASSGIGRATAALFAREGASLIITARRKAELDALADEVRGMGADVVAIVGDIRNETLLEQLVGVAVATFGGLDIAFNNAGMTGPDAPLPDIPLSAWREVLETNLTACFLGAKYQLPAMVARGGGSIIFTSTFVGYTVGFPGLSAYAASKAGLIGMTQVIAAEFGSKRIRANALLPGGTDTPMGNAVANTDEMKSFVDGLHALKRRAAPEEIANAALFLASEAAGFVTGTAMLVDGGVSICRT